MKQIALIDGEKKCSKCKTIKSNEDFCFDKSSKDGRGYYCRICASETSRKNHLTRIYNDPFYKRQKRNGWVKRAHKISLEEYENKLAAQNYKCAICNLDLKPEGHMTHLDHDHTTGKIRDFLCTNCNRGLGHFQDSIEFLKKAISYLEFHTVDGTQKGGRRP